MTMKQLPAVDRPREKLVKYGPEKLATIELLAIILGVGTTGLTVLQLARKLHYKYGYDLPRQTVATLRQTLGLGEVKACQVVAAFELARRYSADNQADVLITARDVWLALKDLARSRKEHFVVLYLDARQQEIQREIISIGTVNASLVHPREVFELAVRNLASAIIVAHNHPTGNLEPSYEDIKVTERLVEAGKIMGIALLDHVIISPKSYFSFKEHKQLS